MDIAILPPLVFHLLQNCSACLDPRLRDRWPLLVLGILFARGRRTVTTWLRVLGVTKSFSAFYYALGAVGRKSRWIAHRLFWQMRTTLPQEDILLFAIDDTPTQRVGPCVEGAGFHHHPSPGPTDQKFLYGHVWVTLAWLRNHPLWNWIALPLWARLYVRQKDISKIPPNYKWTFRTKLELAKELLHWLKDSLRNVSQQVQIVADGFYAKSIVIKTVCQLGMTMISRLRRDAALYDLPQPSSGRGRPRIYGKNRIWLSRRMSHRGGWQTVEVNQYGQRRTKTIKTFLATWRPAGGVIRVVLVREKHGCEVFFCTHTEVSVERILEVMAGRFSIEETFKDLKEVWGAGEQQLRNIHANEGAFQSCLWSFSLVEWWSWSGSHEELCDRSQSPWDDPGRRPSHADRRRALQRCCLEEELLRLEENQAIAEEIRTLLERWQERALR